jgi:hypothetical protein
METLIIVYLVSAFINFCILVSPTWFCDESKIEGEQIISLLVLTLLGPVATVFMAVTLVVVLFVGTSKLAYNISDKLADYINEKRGF